MIIFIEKSDSNSIVFRATANQGDGIFETVVELRPGEDFIGHPFEDILSLGLGEHDVKERK